MLWRQSGDDSEMFLKEHGHCEICPTHLEIASYCSTGLGTSIPSLELW